MSINIVDLLEGVAGLAAAAIALLAVYRSLTIGKSLVTRVYRTRAYWLAVLMMIFAVVNADVFSSAIASDISYWGFFVFLFALLFFIDSNVVVAREIDFFHRDILRWHKVRIPMFVAIVASSAIAIVASADITAPVSLSGVAILVYFTLIGAALAYSGAVMFVIARTSYDRTMKRFVKMLGFAVLFYVLFVTIWLPLDFIYPNLGDVVTDFIAIGTAYFFYKAAMSLSFVGRIEKQIA